MRKERDDFHDVALLAAMTEVLLLALPSLDYPRPSQNQRSKIIPEFAAEK